MTGPEHYREAESLLGKVLNRDVAWQEILSYAVIAQVHATLALAAATAQGIGAASTDPEWDTVTGVPS